MPSFNDKQSTKKGNIGEAILRKYFENQGFIVYKSLTDAPHPVDFIRMKGKKPYNEIVLCECKTKECFIYNGFRETGFNTSNYLDYLNIKKTLNLPLYIYFIDADEGMIYGNNFDNLIKPYIERRGSVTNVYPREYKGITLFSRKQMKEVASLSKEDIENIKKYSKN